MKHKRRLRAILLALAVAMTAVMMTACVEFPPYDGDDFERPGLDVTEYRPIEEAHGVTIAPGATLCYGGVCTDAWAQEISVNPELMLNLRRNNSKQDLTGLNQKDYTGGAFATLYMTGYKYVYLLRNTSTEPVTVAVTTTDAQSLQLGSNTVGIKTYNTYSRFTAPTTGVYEIALVGWTSGLNAVSFYADDGQAQYFVTEQNDAEAKRYRVLLREGQDLFMLLRGAAEGALTARVQAHTSEYTWCENGTAVTNSTVRVRRNGTASGALTLHSGSNAVSGSLKVTGTDLSVENGAVKAVQKTQLSIASSYFGYAQWLDESNVAMSEKLFVEIIPSMNPTLYPMSSVKTNCVFGIKNIEALTHGTTQESVSITVEVTDGAKVYEQVITTSEAEEIYVEPIGRWEKGAVITLSIKSIRYTISGRSVTYTQEYYPEIITGESITLTVD